MTDTTWTPTDEHYTQARAEAEKRYNTGSVSVGDYLTMSDAFVQGADWAATRTRTITTTTELDALPIGSVVLSEYEAVWERESDLCWIETGNTWRVQSTDIALPARVLYTPEEDA